MVFHHHLPRSHGCIMAQNLLPCAPGMTAMFCISYCFCGCWLFMVFHNHVPPSHGCRMASSLCPCAPEMTRKPCISHWFCWWWPTMVFHNHVPSSHGCIMARNLCPCAAANQNALHFSWVSWVIAIHGFPQSRFSKPWLPAAYFLACPQ